ncbi:MAG: HlyD family efflux transporter periplasmic adaptor subunit [Candidatus Binatia bacterium]
MTPSSPRRGLALALALALLAGCAGLETAPPEAPPPVAVTVAPARRGAIAATLAATGETLALTSLRLASPVAGRITALPGQPGDRVAAGAVAARVLPQENEAALHGFGVLASAGALRPEERPAAARLAREIAARDIALSAPFSGIVAERHHNPGEQVAAGEVLLELFDPRSLVVLAQVPAARGGALRPGQSARVRVGGETLAGQVAAVLAAVSPQSLTIPVRIRLAAPPAPPLLRAAAECEISVAERGDALLVPRAALLADDGRDGGTGMVAAGGVAHLQRVRLGLRAADAVEVRDGLADGDLVLVAGQYGLPDGTAVVPQPAAE